MTEWEEQREIVQWFRRTYPEHPMAIRASMNGLNLGAGRKAAVAMNQMRAQGLVEGESDIAILLPRQGYGCLLVEHKAAGGTHKITPDQQNYLDYHTDQGNCAVSTKGVEAAKGAIRTYMKED